MNRTTTIINFVLLFVMVLWCGFITYILIGLGTDISDLQKQVVGLQSVTTQVGPNTTSQLTEQALKPESTITTPKPESTTTAPAKRTLFKTQSAFLKAAVEWFDSDYGDRSAWARPFGYGTVSFLVDTPKVEWFAYCNTDAYFQILFSDVLPADIKSKAIRQKDRLERYWEAGNTSSWSESSIQQKNWGWLGESNLWVEDEKLCWRDKEDRWHVDDKRVLDTTVKKINEALGIKVEVVEYLE